MSQKEITKKLENTLRQITQNQNVWDEMQAMLTVNSYKHLH